MMGIFQTSKNATSFQVEKRKENYYLNFKTSLDNWSKKIILLNHQKLILEHGGKKFFYKRPQLINLNNE